MNLFVLLCLFSTIALINVSPTDSTPGVTEGTAAEDDTTSTTEGAAEEENVENKKEEDNNHKQFENRLKEIEEKLGDLQNWQEDMEKKIMKQLKKIREDNKRAIEQQEKDMENKLIKPLKTISEANKRAITQQEEDIKKMTGSGYFNCLRGWTKLVFGCFMIVNSTYSWPDALQICEREGGFLAETRKQSELNAVVKLLFDNPNEFYWLGGSDANSDGQYWRWVRTKEKVEQPDGFGKIKASPWKSGKPDNKPGHRACLAIQSDGTWEDMDCEIKARALCQLEKYSPKTCPYALPLY